MDRRYQIFVSSTFRDLKAEREAALEAILEMGHFPAGMEAFTASNETAWALIERTIKECDYYVLIIGGRYGSAGPDGLSYTEREYDLAISLGIPVVPQLHGNPDQIEAGKSEMDAEARKRLDQFRKKVEAQHHCKYWENASDLKSKILLGLQYMIRIDPRVGWVRADGVDNTDLLKQINELRIRHDALAKENYLLKAKLEPLAQQDLERPFEFEFSIEKVLQNGKELQIRKAKVALPVKAWFSAVAPRYLRSATTAEAFTPILSLATTQLKLVDERLLCLNDSIDPLMIELMHRGLVEPCEIQTTQGPSLLGNGTHREMVRTLRQEAWKLTPEGRSLYAELSGSLRRKDI